MLLTTPIPHTEAADLVRAKLPVTRRIFDALAPELRAAALVISGVEDLRVIERVRNLAAGIPEGGDWDEAKRRIIAEIGPWMDDDDAAERRAELLLRSHAYAAYATANYRALEEQKDIFTWRKYQTAQDERVRGTHAALDGIIAPANSPFWRDHTPPWDFGCRCDIVGLTDDDVAEMRQTGSQILTEDGKPGIKIIEPGTPELDALEQGHLFRDQTMHFVARDPGHYTFDPEAPLINIAMLEGMKQRVGPKAWAAFQDWARGAEVPGVGPVWDWMTKEPDVPMRRLVGTFARVPLPPIPLKVPARTSPLSAKIELASDLRDGTLPRYIDHAGRLIDIVHDEGGLSPIRLVRDDDPTREAYYDPASNRIGIRLDTRFPITSTLHEVGHWLDFRAWSSEFQGRYLESVNRRGSWSSRLVADLREMPTLRAIVSEARLSQGDKEYLLNDKEIFARAYAQFIATASGDRAAKAELDGWRGVNPHLVFTKKETYYIKRAMRGGLAQLKWNP